MTRIRRRTFLQGCCAAIAAMNGSRLGNLVFAQGGGPQRDILVVVFLRGGMDALSFLAPYSDANYADARPRLRLTSAQVSDIDGYFGLHPSAAALRDLYTNQHLALIPAAGFPESNRSHFEAQDYYERGQLGASTTGGWLARHLATMAGGDVFQAVSIGSSVAVSLEGMSEALAMDGADGFEIAGHWNQVDDIRAALRRMYAYDDRFGVTALRTLDIADIIEANPPGDYVPRNGVVYPNTGFADRLLSVAQLIRMDVGLEVATLDLGGWDTHENQASGSNSASGTFANLVSELSGGLNAFWTDLQDYHGRLTVMVMSEFGRRLRENASIGTDHGHGGLMMVLSANIAQRKVWGVWPGLANEQLFERVDVHATTDFRTVITEVMAARRAHADPATLFPGFAYPGPLGLFAAGGSLVGTTSSVGDWARY
jgi:uncharacterized protein (DUF1501 family)